MGPEPVAEECISLQHNAMKACNFKEPKPFYVLLVLGVNQSTMRWGGKECLDKSSFVV